MHFLLNAVAWTVVITVGIPLAVLAAQCLLALLPPPRFPRGQRRSIAVLVPAHNESAVLRATIDNAQLQLVEGDRLVVIADNCSDATAEIARQAGVEVVERFDTVRRGKGFALDAGVRHLESSPPELVIVLDADCEISPGALDDLARLVDATGQPAQALYLMRMSPDASPEVMVSTFAFLVKNWVRPRGLQRLRLPVLLTGTGMAFPWPIIRDATLATGDIVEDMVLGIELTRRGIGPLFCESAVVWSDLPNSAEAAISQRTRWEHGYLGSMLRFTPGMLVDGVRRVNPSLFLTGLDLVVPPLALLVLTSLLAIAIIVCIGFWSSSILPLVVLSAVGTMAAAGLLLCWWRFARNLIPIGMVFAIPGYVFRKVGIYRRFVERRQTQWVRTQRDGEA